jgi:hypothetical protein
MSFAFMQSEEDKRTDAKHKCHRAELNESNVYPELFCAGMVGASVILVGELEDNMCS